jgi:hypothetical protein
MNRFVLTAAAALISTPAGAVTIVLQSTSPSGPNTLFSYGGSFAIDPANPASLTPIEGLVNGSQLVIFDFAGYVGGSVSSPYANVAATAELLSDPDLLAPGAFDDPTLYNLVFTWTDGAFTPAPGFAFAGLSALSIYSGIDPAGSPFGSHSVTVANNTPLYVSGYVASPIAVPEPASWALLFGGFGLIGLAARRATYRISFAV